MTTTPVRYSFWGGHYPPVATTFWHGHFPEPDGTSLAIVRAAGLVGVAMLALVLEDGASVTYTFPTDVIKFRSGKEQRVAGRDYPKQTYKGNVTLVGDDVRVLRGQLARYVALGLPFQLALPHEETTVASPSSGTVVDVGSTSLLDWAVPGQTVEVVDDVSRIAAVVQSKTGTTITLDVALGALGVVGARVMPTVPVYLDAQQGFERYPPVDGAEVWQISARAIQPGFTSASVGARLALSTMSTSGVLAALVAYANTLGLFGNGITLSLQHATLGFGINVTITEDPVALTILVKFHAGVATVQNLVDALATSALITLEGTFTSGDVLNVGVDEWSATHLAGGVDGAAVPVGAGASVTTYDGRPVWDRGVMVDSSTAMDSLHSLTELVDLGGTPFNPADGTVGDWGRQVSVTSDSTAEFQWLKLMLATIRGSQVAFWLPSWRSDMKPVAVTAGSAAVGASVAFNGWSTGNASGLVATAITTGTIGNGWLVKLVNTGSPSDAAGTLTVGFGLTFTLNYVAGTTTIAQAVALLNGSLALTMSGTYTGSNKLLSTDQGSAYMVGGAPAIGAVIVVPQAAASGDYAAWSTQRDHLRVIQVDGTVTYAKVVSVVTDGVAVTFKISVDATLSGSVIASLSWLELVRLESEDVVVTFKDATFHVLQQARVVQQ